MKALLSRAKDLIFKFSLDPSEESASRHPIHLNYESGQYRQSDLVKLVRDAVVHFALTPEEFDEYITKNGDVGEASRVAWSRISDVSKNSKGDYGELLLFLVLKLFFPASERFVTKARLRSSTKDQIKGFDCAHFTVEGEDVVLWLGEAKFHQSFSTAIDGALESIQEHCEREYLKDEFSILFPNIELNRDYPHRDKLQNILNGSRSLDSVKFKIPVLLTYDCAKLKNHSSITTDEFLQEMKEEFVAKFKVIEGRGLVLKDNFEVVFIVFPLESVKTIKDELEKIESASR